MELVLELTYTLLKTTHLGEHSGVRPTDVPEKRLRHKRSSTMRDLL
jgi:hypothetical protein